MQQPAATAFYVDGPQGPLQAVFQEPPSSAADAAVLIAHPHPAFEGTMDNKVVTTVARAAKDCGLASLRFNYRGVGDSAGTIHDGGPGIADECEDLDAAFDWLAGRYRRLLLAGFSFGSALAASRAGRYAQRTELLHLALIAPPVERYPDAFAGSLPCPCTLVQGDGDELVDAAAVRTWSEHHDEVRYHQLADTGHFFHGRLQLLKEHLQRDWRHCGVC